MGTYVLCARLQVNLRAHNWVSGIRQYYEGLGAEEEGMIRKRVATVLLIQVGKLF